MTAKIIDGVGIAEEPSKYQHKKFHRSGQSLTSFNQLRADFLEETWLETTRSIILNNPDIRPRGGRTLKEIFNDLVSDENKKFLGKMWQNNLISQESDPFGRELKSALLRTMADVVPNIKAESLLPWIEKQIPQSAQKYSINPDNLSQNSS